MLINDVILALDQLVNTIRREQGETAQSVILEKAYHKICHLRDSSEPETLPTLEKMEDILSRLCNNPQLNNRNSQSVLYFLLKVSKAVTELTHPH